MKHDGLEKKSYRLIERRKNEIRKFFLSHEFLINILRRENCVLKSFRVFGGRAEEKKVMMSLAAVVVIALVRREKIV